MAAGRLPWKCRAAGGSLVAKVVLEDVWKSYGAEPVVKGLDLAVEHNEFVALVGPSGCGKSTILRMISGLEELTRGTIMIGDIVVNDLRPRERNVAMVFQNYALYPHMTVRENLSFGLKLAKTPKDEIESRVGEAATTLGLADKLGRKPSQLSGGERQRVAMGRAMVRRPDVFLFDEPLSNLDAKLRTTMRTEIKRLHRQVQTTVIYVTHDQVEAMTLADRIVILRDGHVEQVGTPLDVFFRPANIFVAGFIGSPPMNFLTATMADDGALQIGNGTRLPMPRGRFRPITPGRSLTLGIRAEDMSPKGQGHETSYSWEFSGVVNFSEPLGSETLLITELSGQEVVAKMYRSAPAEIGEKMAFQLNLERLHIFDPETGASLAAEVAGPAG